MTPRAERRLLQVTMTVVLFVPLSGGAMGVLRGPEWLDPLAAGTDLDSHFRYLSGLLLAMAALFLSCIPGIENKGTRLRLIAILPITGGLARLFALIADGTPGTTHLVALGLELGVVPLIVLWQARMARRFTAP